MLLLLPKHSYFTATICQSLPILLLFFLNLIIFNISGGYRFFSDLLNKINALNTGMSAEASGKSLPVSMEFIRIKSYTNDRWVQSSVRPKSDFDIGNRNKGPITVSVLKPKFFFCINLSLFFKKFKKQVFLIIYSHFLGNMNGMICPETKSNEILSFRALGIYNFGYNVHMYIFSANENM